jgi:DNA helicase-2/ATP-dependent DNA helicase PcrA
MEEERRLAYVGITRAEERLYLTRAYMRTLYGRTNTNMPSRFVSEIPAELLDGAEPQEQRSAGRFASRSNDFRSPMAGSTGTSGSVTKVSSQSYHPTGKLPQHGQGAGINWKLGEKVKHTKWGIGTIVSTKGSGDDLELDIAFPSPTGVKKLLAKFAPIERV